MIPDSNTERNVGAPKYTTSLPLTFLPPTTSVENAETVWGTSYRWLRDFAELHGVTIYRVGRKFLIDSVELYAAIKEYGPKQAAAEADPVRVESQVDTLRRELGLVKK